MAECDPNAALTVKIAPGWTPRLWAARLSKVDRGDVYHMDLSPTQGREQAGARYALIVSPQPFNILGTPLVCPITQGGNFARHAGFAVFLSGAGTETQGVVLPGIAGEATALLE
jgi:hypothetical protein